MAHLHPSSSSSRRWQSLLVAVISTVVFTTAWAERGRVARRGGDAARASANAIVLRSGHEQEEELGSLDFTSALESVWEDFTGSGTGSSSHGCCKVIDAKEGVKSSQPAASEEECATIAKNAASGEETLSHQFSAGHPCSGHGPGKENGTGCCIMGLKDDRILAEISSEADCAKRAKRHEASTSNFNKDLQDKACEAQSTHEEVKNLEGAKHQGCCIIVKTSGDQVVARMSNATCVKKIVELQNLVKTWSFDDTVGPENCKQQDPEALSKLGQPKGCCVVHFKPESRKQDIHFGSQGAETCQKEAKTKAKEAELEETKYQESPCQHEDEHEDKPASDGARADTASTIGTPEASQTEGASTTADTEGTGVAESTTSAPEEAGEGSTSTAADLASSSSTTAEGLSSTSGDTVPSSTPAEKDTEKQASVAASLTISTTSTPEQETNSERRNEEEAKKAGVTSTTEEGAFVVDVPDVTTSSTPQELPPDSSPHGAWQPGCCVITLKKESVKAMPADTPDQCQVLAEQDKSKADESLFKYEFKAGQSEQQCHSLEVTGKTTKPTVKEPVDELKTASDTTRNSKEAHHSNSKDADSSSSSSNINSKNIPIQSENKERSTGSIGSSSSSSTPGPKSESESCCVVSIRSFAVDFLPSLSQEDCQEQLQESLGAEQVELAGVKVEQKQGVSCDEASNSDKVSPDRPSKFEEESSKLDLNTDRIEKVSKGTRKVNQMTNLVHSQMLTVAFWESKVKDERKELLSMENFAEKERQKLSSYQDDEQKAYKQLLADQNTIGKSSSSTSSDESKGCCIIVANDDPDDSERTATPNSDEASCHAALYEKLKGKRPYTATFHQGPECD